MTPEQFEKALEPLTYKDLSEALRYALDRCVDKVKNGETLPHEGFNGFDIYADRAGDKISRWISRMEDDRTIFRDQVDG